jgi:hypothetical protein
MEKITKQIVLEKIRAAIEDYKTHADELLKIINTQFAGEKDRLKNITILTIQRYYSGLIALSTLIKEFQFYKPIEFTYALILRTLILDFITIEYLKSQNELSFDEFSKALERVNYLSARDTNIFCENIKNNKEGFRRFISEKVFPENFSFDNKTGYYIIKKPTKQITPRAMAEYFKESKCTYAFDAYKLYSQYSLIEHLSNLTFIAMQGDDEMDSKNLIWSMFYIFHGHDSCFEILDFYPKHAPEIVRQRDYFLNLLKEI